jgi:hypothetical protein
VSAELDAAVRELEQAARELRAPDVDTKRAAVPVARRSATRRRAAKSACCDGRLPD